MANDRDYNREEDLRGEPAREDERREPSEQGERGERGERDIRTSNRGVERSDWSDAVTSDDAAEPSEERSADPDELEGQG